MGLLVLKGCEDEGGSAGAGWGGVGVWEDGGVGGKHQVWGVRLGRAAGQDGPGLPGCGSGKGDAGRDPQGLSWSPPGVAVCIPSRKSLRQRLIRRLTRLLVLVESMPEAGKMEGSGRWDR